MKLLYSNLKEIKKPEKVETPYRKKFLYVNWKTGLGDAILHISLYYHYAKFTNQKIFFYGNSNIIDKKMREVAEVFSKNQSDIFNWIEQVPIKSIKNENGVENFSEWIPIPSDNCKPQHWDGYNINSFISKFVKVMNFENVIRKADELIFPHGYLNFTGGQVQHKIVFQLIGHSSGKYDTNYHITKNQIIELVNRVKQDGMEVVFIQPHDNWTREQFPWATFKNIGNNMNDLFNEISTARAVVGVDSGIAHVAKCCQTPLNIFRIQRSGGLGFGSEDANFIDDTLRLSINYN